MDKRRQDRAERDERDRTKLLAKYADIEPDGVVVCQYGSHADTVFADGSVLMCMLTPKVHKLFGVCVGDRVWTETASGDNERVIVARANRETEVRRKRGDDDRTGHVIAANVDRMAITVALYEPPLRQGAIDRYLVLASVLGIEPVLVLTKVDQSPPDDPGWVLIEPYLEMGIPLIGTSAESGEGIERLRDLLTDHVTVFAGHSGVGKSSLCQALGLEGAMDAGDMSYSGGRVRGRHKTSVARLLELPSGGFVVDTPGVRAIGLVDLKREDARVHFPEFAEFSDSCAYANCLHVDEDDCAVWQAVEDEELNDSRYASYLRLMESLES